SPWRRAGGNFTVLVPNSLLEIGGALRIAHVDRAHLDTEGATAPGWSKLRLRRHGARLRRRRPCSRSGARPAGRDVGADRRAPLASRAAARRPSTPSSLEAEAHGGGANSGRAGRRATA